MNLFVTRSEAHRGLDAFVRAAMDAPAVLDGSSIVQGWRPVGTAMGSETPPPLVGSTLTCIEVPLHSKDLRTAAEQDHAVESSEQVQLGL